MPWVLTFFAVVLSVISNPCYASELNNERKNEKEALEETDNPILFDTVLQIKPVYTLIDEGGWSYGQTNRVVAPFRGAGTPGIQIGDFYSLIRFDAPIIYQTTSKINQWGNSRFRAP